MNKSRVIGRMLMFAGDPRILGRRKYIKLKAIIICWTCSVLSLTNITYGQSWQFFAVDNGVKPALDLDSNGIPHISYMLESHSGYVKHAILDPVNLDFELLTVSEGYFYGPLDLAIDQDDIPHISYHNHTLQDQVHSHLAPSGWVNERIQDPGHDGWDNSITMDINNRVHTSTVDPSGFGGAGVEYAFFNGSVWQVEAVGSGSIMYANSTSLALDSQGQPHITYYDDGARDLMYAVKKTGNWVISVVETSGDVGRFASLSLDPLDVPHMSYYRHLTDSTGIVKFARWNGSGWNITNIDTLEKVFIGFAGARNMTSLVLDLQGKPHVGYGDEKVLKYAVLDGTTWQREVVLDVSATSTILGQLTSLQLDTQGNPHIAYYEVTSKSPLTGIVKYTTQNMITSVHQEAVNPNKVELLQNYPNPFNPSTKIRYELPERSHVTLKIFNLLGRKLATLVDEEKGAGRYEVSWDAGRFAAGLYFYRLQTGEFAETKKLLLLR